MGGFTGYDRYDAVGLALLVRRREVSARELLEEAAARSDRADPTLNAVIYRMDEAAAEAASGIDPDLPLAGVPFLAKDLGPAVGGAPLTSGSRLLANYVPDEDGELIKRFKRAGLVVFGKTNVPEFGLVPVTEPELFGPCRNPWNLNRTPGGSSGGAASAVAAGIVPMAHASDGGGSIRIPASCCGLFGLKTSRGLNPKSSDVQTITSDFGVDHVVSRSVRDSAAALDAVCNPGNGGFLSGLETPPRSLRVAVVRSAMFASKVEPEVGAALDHAVKLMLDLGHQVEDAEPEVNYKEFGAAFLTLWAIGAQEALDLTGQLLGRKPALGHVEARTWSLAAAGRMLRGTEEKRAGQVIGKASKTFNAFFERYDILLSPVLATPPLRIGETRMTGAEEIALRLTHALKSPWLMTALLKAVAAKSFDFAAFTAPFNVSGQPAMSVPLHWTPDGLPVGIQFAGRIGADGLLLRLARQLELAAGWQDRRPPIWAGEIS
jgi:Asp-tRNA(Asn)/Glu-tRNA(Gln) amidotransferase A subunit family amidase